MSSLLEQLANESILVLYLADELPAEDRAEVEQQLHVDAGLRAELRALEQAERGWRTRLASLDRTSRLPVDESTAVGRVASVMKGWSPRPAPAPVSANSSFQWRRQIWLYPVAAAAIVLIAFGLVFKITGGPATKSFLTIKHAAINDVLPDGGGGSAIAESSDASEQRFVAIEQSIAPDIEVRTELRHDEELAALPSPSSDSHFGLDLATGEPMAVPDQPQ